MSELTHRKPKKKLLSLPSVAGLLVATALIGQVLGFLRVKIIIANFPTTGPQGTDAYFAAFTIPDFFFFAVAAGALGVAFMPVLSDHLERGDSRRAWQISSSLLNFMALIMLFVGLLIVLFPQQLLSIVAPELVKNPEQLHNAVNIMRFLAFNPFLFTIGGIIASVQQTMGRFFFYAIAPIFYNLSIIASVYLFRDNIGIIGLGIGAFIGAVVQLLVILVGLKNSGYHWRPKINFKDKDFRLVLRNLPPRSIDQGADQVNVMVETRFANQLKDGDVTNYNIAYTLHTAPILLIGTAISTAAFPRLNARLSQGRPDLFRRDFLRILRVMIWIAIPVAIITFFLRGYLTRAIFSDSSSQIAVILGFLTVAIFFRIIYALVSRWFYAQKDTRTPLYVSLFTIALNITLAYFLTKKTGYGVAGLAIAQSIVAAVEVGIMYVIMGIRDHKLFTDVEFWSGCLKIVSVSGFSLVVGYIMVKLLPLSVTDVGFVTLSTKMFAIALPVFATHVFLSWLFDLDEAKAMLGTIKRFILRPIKGAPVS
ncbi:MAG: lipid II flippase MurJ [Candidatus Saccharimonadales bacterium]